MIVDLPRLKKFDACRQGIKWFESTFSEKSADHAEIVKAAMADGRWSYAGWLLIHLMTSRDKNSYVVYASRRARDFLADTDRRNNTVASGDYVIEVAKRAVADGDIKDFLEVMFVSLMLVSSEIRCEMIDRALELVKR